MSKKIPEKDKKKRGPKGKISIVDLGQMERLYRFGMTDEQVCEFFDIAVSTLHEWKKKPEISKSIKKGKSIADAKMKQSLFRSGVGYSHPDVDVRVVGQKIVKTAIIRHHPPNPTAAIFWMKNRQPEKWKDKQEIDHNHTIRPMVMVNDATKKEE